MADYAHEWTDGEIEKLEKKFKRTYKQAAKEMRKKLDDYLEDFDKSNSEWKRSVKAGDATDKQYRAWLKSQSVRKEYLIDMVEMLARDAANTNKLAADYINDAIPTVYAENANYAAYGIEMHLGKNTHSFDLYDRDTIRHIMGMGKDDQINKEVIPYGIPKPPLQSLRVHPEEVKDVRWNRQKFTASITQSILQGESIPETAKRLKRILNMNEVMSVRAARTAMTSAENSGRIDSYSRAKSIGIELEQEWMATLDSRTRTEHRLLNGQHVPVGKRFVPDGYGERYSIGFPADPTALPEMVWNCRCTLVAWFPDIEREDPEQWSRLPENMTYGEWKANKQEKKDGDE